MDTKQFNRCFDQAFRDVLTQQTTQIELPPDSVIQASWSVVSKRMEQERQQRLLQTVWTQGEWINASIKQ
ncbi:hypothetical protein [Paenibacillus sp. MBLB4367]|uniref:hypothetical protein n=1 Tax=Paenibacillus sp. MBLB4367 TaxID=3384767 RepID=UPI00390800F1